MSVLAAGEAAGGGQRRTASSSGAGQRRTTASSSGAGQRRTAAASGAGEAAGGGGQSASAAAARLEAWDEAQRHVLFELGGHGRLNAHHVWVMKMFAVTVSWQAGRTDKPTVEHAVEHVFKKYITPEVLEAFQAIFDLECRDPSEREQREAGVFKASIDGERKVRHELPGWVKKIVYGVRTKVTARDGEDVGEILRRIVDHLVKTGKASKSTIATLTRLSETQAGRAAFLFFLAGEGGIGRLGTYLRGPLAVCSPDRAAEGDHRSLVRAACDLGLQDRLSVEAWALVCLPEECKALQQFTEGTFVALPPSPGFSDDYANHCFQLVATSQNSRPGRSGGVNTTGVDVNAPEAAGLKRVQMDLWYDRTAECLRNGRNLPPQKPGGSSSSSSSSDIEAVMRKVEVVQEQIRELSVVAKDIRAAQSEDDWERTMHDLLEANEKMFDRLAEQLRGKLAAIIDNQRRIIGNQGEVRSIAEETLAVAGKNDRGLEALNRAVEEGFAQLNARLDAVETQRVRARTPPPNPSPKRRLAERSAPQQKKVCSVSSLPPWSSD